MIAQAVVHIAIPIPSESHDGWEKEGLGFKLEVSDSGAACGFGNVTLDGQALPQTLVNGISSGKGSVTTDRKSIIVGSWDFLCVNVNGIPDSQLLKFVIDFVDGNAVKDVGFSVLFRQYGTVEIIKIETDLSIPDEILANPNPVALRPLHNPEDIPEYNIEEELAELDYLWAQMHELKYLIHEKERAIAHHSHKNPDPMEEELGECDSLKCIAKAIAKEAKNAAFSLYGKVSGDDEEFSPRGKPHFRRPHFRKPHFPKHPFHCPKNSTHPPHRPEGNHTHIPHKRPLPICRYPPPPPHHRKPPHHGKPFEHMPPPEFDGPHRGPPGFGRPPPMHPSEESPDFDGPLQKHHGMKPHEESPEDDSDFNGRPDFNRPELQQGKGPHDGPPDFDSPPPHGYHHGKPPHHEGPPHDGPGPHLERPGLEDQERIRPEGGFHPHPMFDGPGPQDHGPGPHYGPPGPPPGLPPGARALNVVKYTAIGFLCAFLLLALHRRACTPKRRADRQARREARHARRAYRRAAHKHIITRILARISGHGSDDEYGDYEEKREALLASAEDGMSTTMTEEIGQLRNAADVVAEIVEAEESSASSPTPSQSISLRSTQPGSSASEDRPLLREFEMSMLNVGGEELPAYEDNDGSEDSSVVADGFRYTPGSSNYSPSHSPTGSVSDILGPDTKS